MTKLSQQISDTSVKVKKTPLQQLSLLGRAIRYLSLREHSQEELIRKLKPHVATQEELDRVLEQLITKGLQSNQRFAENLVRKQSVRYGHRRVAEELKRNKIDSPTSAQLISNMRSTEFDRALAIWSKKFGEVSADPKEIARQGRFLANRGFDLDLISKIIRGKVG